MVTHSLYYVNRVRHCVDGCFVMCYSFTTHYLETRSPEVEENVKFTIYVPPQLKEDISRLAKENSIPTSASNFAAYLLRLGLKMHTGEEAYVQREVMIETK